MQDQNESKEPKSPEDKPISEERKAWLARRCTKRRNMPMRVFWPSAVAKTYRKPRSR